MTTAEITDPLNWSGPPSQATWTTANASEAIQGVPTPLTWSWFRPAIDVTLFGPLYSLGALSRREYQAERTGDAASCAIFYGRPALNVNRFRALLSRLPTMSGDGVEEQLFGGVYAGAQDGEGSRRRYPMIALRTPAQLLTATTRLRRAHAETVRWWRASVDIPADPVAARALLDEAFRVYLRNFHLHGLASMVGMALFDQLAAASRHAGLDGHEMRLVTGYGSLIEGRLLQDIWRLSRGVVTEAEVLRTHGYQCPDSGEISGYAWREDPTPLRQMADRFANLDADQSPSAMMVRAAGDRAEAEREILARTGSTRRATLRAALVCGRAVIPYRELGKAAYLLAMDVGRAAARALGTALKADGSLGDRDDIFCFTATELTGLPGADLSEVAAVRTSRRELYRTTRVPEVWRGMPEAVPAETRISQSGNSVRGLPVSAGVVRGIARVVARPDDCTEFEHGDVLVCATTDPSWAPLIMQAGAMVVDIGGAMSHGAIVARELGVPCVVNTVHGTSHIADGDTVVVDGSTGVIDIIRTREEERQP